MKIPFLKGAIIRDVLMDSPAYIAGIKIKDIITHFNKIPLKNYSDIQLITVLRKPKRFYLTVFRDNSYKDLIIFINFNLLNKKIKSKKLSKNTIIKFMGLLLGVLNIKKCNSLKLKANINCIKIISLKKTPKFITYDLQKGDLIIMMNCIKINKIKEFILMQFIIIIKSPFCKSYVINLGVFFKLMIFIQFIFAFSFKLLHFLIFNTPNNNPINLIIVFFDNFLDFIFLFNKLKLINIIKSLYELSLNTVK
jgi:hypothetical protein